MPCDEITQCSCSAPERPMKRGSMIVLSEDSDRLPPSASARENHAATEIAKLLGLRVYYMPDDFSVCETAENALAYVPIQDRETTGVWIGYIPAPERYEAIYHE